MTLIIPAIDIQNGSCVRLYQGSYKRETVYFDDPVKMAMLWRVQNAKVLHLVDMDAALGGGKHNREIVKAICKRVDIPVQLGGGIRTMTDIDDALSAGVYRVILGTVAVTNPDLVTDAIKKYSASRVVVGIDARDGDVKIQGWTQGSGLNAIDVAIDMEKRGCRRIIYTDISRDGTLKGPALQTYRNLGKNLKRIKITASGGVSNYLDLMKIKDLSSSRVDSVIIGRALYENNFPCQKIWCWNYKEKVDLNKFSTACLAK